MAKTTTALKNKLPRPDEIKDFLDQYVIGQEDAKKILSVAVYNHYKRVHNNNSRRVLEMDKSNVILLGPTGCGKTHLVKSVAKLLGVPYYIQDCTKITASGYVGSDVEDCIVGLLRNSKYDISRAEMGIVMLDEGDKIAKKSAGPSITRDVSGECVQQSLLKILEGDVVGVMPQGGRKHPEASLTYVNTKNILFILSGAFVGLSDIIKARRQKSCNSIGFGVANNAKKEEANLEKYATPHDLMRFGMIPEFVGRFPVITNVDKLTEADLVNILTEPKNSIVKQYKALLKEDNVNLSFTKEALQEIAATATRMNTGARGLRGIMECVMTDVMFSAPKDALDGVSKIVIDAADVKERVAMKYGTDSAA